MKTQYYVYINEEMFSVQNATMLINLKNITKSTDPYTLEEIQAILL